MQHPNSDLGTQAIQSRGPIVIVDDDSSYSAMLRDTIASWKLPNTIQMLTQGEKLIEYLNAHRPGGKPDAEYPALVILDLRMPTMSGVEVMQALKDQGHNITPVVIISGSRDFKAIAETYELGAYCFISKPPREGDMDKVKHALGIWNR